MSDSAPAPERPSLIGQCAQCSSVMPHERSRLARHAIPCGHVVCGDCCAKLAAEEKSGSTKCKSPGCMRTFECLDEWPAALCTGRAERIKASQADAFGDQGNVGDGARPVDSLCDECGPDADTGKPHPATHWCAKCKKSYCKAIADVHPRMRSTRGHMLTRLAASPGPSFLHSVCIDHGEAAVMAEVGTHRLACLACMAQAPRDRVFQSLEAALESARADHDAQEAEAARQQARLLELKVDPDRYRAEINEWAGQETARIRDWEEREVKAIHAVADRLVASIEELRAYRLEVGMGLLVQRLGLAASLEEAEKRLKDLPEDEAERRARTIELTAVRKELTNLLCASRIDFVSADVFGTWAALPSLASQLDGNGRISLHSSVVESDVALALKLKRFAPSVVPFKAAELPTLRPLDPAKPPRTLSLGKIKPNVFLGLDDDTVVIGCEGLSPLQVWDLRSGTKVREFEGKVTHCLAMARIRPGVLAAGCRERNQAGVSVYDSTTGKLLQRLSGCSSTITNITFASDALLAVCWDNEFIVWTRDASMQFSEHAKHGLSLTPFSLTPISGSTVAILGEGPPGVEIWDWKQGRLLQTLTGFGGLITSSALLPDGRLVAVEWAGKISIGNPNDWKASVVVIDAGAGLLAGLVVARDGSFVTASQIDGGIKHWCGGKCTATQQGGLADDNYFNGNSLAVVGGRLLAVGKGNTVLVFE